MDFLRVIDKPPLFHYTRPESLISILSSGLLWASPTWDFPDTREYVLGLELILRRLEMIYERKLECQELPRSFLLLAARYCIEPSRVLGRIIYHIRHEIANRADPRVRVYVACVTDNNKSYQMAEAYGRCIIQFNWMLPMFSYAVPRPFVSSMLSWVCYEERRFENWIMRMGFEFPFHLSEAVHKAFLDELPAAQRENSIAVTAVILLCSFAANIKEPKYAFEREWRLKTIQSLHTTPTPFAPMASTMRKAFGVGEEAEFTEHKEKRYKQEFRFRDRFIVEDVGVLIPPPVSLESAREAHELLAQVEALRHAGRLAGPMLKMKEELILAAKEGNPFPSIPGIY